MRVADHREAEPSHPMKRQRSGRMPPPQSVRRSSASDTVWHALWRGARGRCPACDAAPLFPTFLKPVELCSACGEDWTRHNADDLPPYIVILVIGHVVVTGMTLVGVTAYPPMWVQLTIWLSMIVALAVGLIQPVKGGVIAFQWWHRMGGFEHRRTLEQRQAP